MKFKISTKELAENLIAYLQEQDPKILAKALAHMIIDNHLLVNFGLLTKEAQDALTSRCTQNSKYLVEFANDGPKGEFKLKKQ